MEPIPSVETPPATTPTAPPPLPQQGSPAPFVLVANGAPCGHSKAVTGCNGKECSERRAKWRAKDAAKRGKSAVASGSVAGAPVSPVGGQPLAPVPTVASAPTPNAGLPPALPWTADIVRPGLRLLLPAIERADVASLKESAAEISPAAVRLVGEKAVWGDKIHHALEESGGAVAAKWLNKTGLSSEFAPELTLCGAIASLIASRSSLKEELAELAAEAKKHREATSTQDKVRSLSEAAAKP